MTSPRHAPGLQLGCIADDTTGATDLANQLVRQGLRTVQTIGVPRMSGVQLPPDVDAVVVALKSRTATPAEAVQQSLAALAWLQAQGAAQIYFKYCSTFDSTPQGNIGPVTDALLDALGSDFTIACPAFPANQRTVYQGHLFVGAQLLSDSGMRHHPLTPMTDANLVRVLQAQTRRRVGLVPQAVVAQGPAAIRQCFAALQAEGVGIAVVDAISDEDLHRIGPALQGMPLVTAGSGIAIGLPAHAAGPRRDAASAAQLPPVLGPRAVLAGSCSTATQAQVAQFLASGHPAFCIDPRAVARGEDVAAAALQALRPALAHGPVLVYATASPAEVQAVQADLGAAHAGALVESTLARMACGLVEAGVRQLIIAGGETSGACVQALGLSQLQIGPQIVPGVPWCHAVSPHAPDGLLLSLKSGNFGGPDFFLEAFTILEEP